MTQKNHSLRRNSTTKKRNLKKKPLKYGDKVRILKKIYSLVPEFADCPPNCGECCGPIICTPLETSYINNWCRKHGIEKRAMLPGHSGVAELLSDPDADIHCHFLTEDKRCEIFPVRPLICRLYGTTRDEPGYPGVMTCPKVNFPDKSKLSRAVSHRLYGKLLSLDGWEDRSMTFAFERHARRRPTG